MWHLKFDIFFKKSFDIEYLQYYMQMFIETIIIVI